MLSSANRKYTQAIGAVKALPLLGRDLIIQTLKSNLANWRVEQRKNSKISLRTVQTSSQHSVGILQKIDTIECGASFEFTHAKLEVVFLKDDVVKVTWETTAGLSEYLQHPTDTMAKSISPGLTDYALAKSGWTSWQTPDVRVTQPPISTATSIATSSLAVSVDKDGSITYSRPSNKLLRSELPPWHDKLGWRQQITLHQRERIYGLGEQAACLNLRNKAAKAVYTLFNQDPGGIYGPGKQPLYMGIPVYMSLRPEFDGSGYICFFNNSYRSQFKFKNEILEVLFDSKASSSPTNDILQYYLFATTPQKAVELYCELTGKPPLPAAWTLGYHQSRWGYKTEQDIKDVVKGFQEAQIPLSAVHMDIDYMDGYRVFTVDPAKFRDLNLAAKELETDGVHLVPIIDCGVKVDDSFELFKQGNQQHYFCYLPDGRLSTGVVWPGLCAFPDFSDPAVRKWWGNQYKIFTDAGISGVWHDMCEPTVGALLGNNTLVSTTRHFVEGRGGDHNQVHNLYALLEAMAGYEGLSRLQPKKRPFILSRSGWAGIQRYAWNWTGDTESTWATLRQTIPTVLGLGLSGVQYSGSDIGGHAGAPDAELYIRWLQMAIFMPFCRTHSSFYTPRREPWAFDNNAKDIIAKTVRMRHRLLPYLYTLACQASLNGYPLIRPLWWNNCSDERLLDADDAFLLGDSMLVAPIVEKGASQREVILPPGIWYGLFDNKCYAGGGITTLDAPLEDIPVLIKAGSIVPLLDTSTVSQDSRQAEEQRKQWSGTGLKLKREETKPGSAVRISPKTIQGTLAKSAYKLAEEKKRQTWHYLCLYLYPTSVATTSVATNSVATNSSIVAAGWLYSDEGDGYNLGNMDCFELTTTQDDACLLDVAHHEYHPTTSTITSVSP